MKKLTSKQAIDEAQKMWTELSASGSDNKRSTSVNVDHYRSSCPYCEYVQQILIKDHDMDNWCEFKYELCLEYCPAIWPIYHDLDEVFLQESTPCQYETNYGDTCGLFEKWYTSQILEERKVLAKLIAELEIKPEGKEAK